MKVLLKIKSVLLLLVVVITTTIAEARNNPFVEWDTVPSLQPWANTADANKMIGFLKNAARGIVPTQGATLYADAGDYKEVWGEALYQQILAAPVSSFGFYQSKGGEQNNGIDVDGNVVPGPILKAGVGLIWLSGIAIAKWDENGCLNAIGTRQTIAPPAPQPTQPTPQQPAIQSTGSQSVTINQGQSVESFYMTYRLGQSDMANIEDRAIDRTITAAERMSKINNCNNCGSASTGNVVLGASNVVYSQGYQQQATQTAYNGPQQVIVRNKANGWEIANTLLNGVNTGLNAINTFRGVRLENDPRSTVVIQNQPDYFCNWNHRNCNINHGGNGNGNSSFVPFHAPTGGSTGGNTSGNGTIRITRSGEINNFN